jgi:hypothetical protein
MTQTTASFPGARQPFVDEQRILYWPFMKLLSGWNALLSHFVANSISLPVGAGVPNGNVIGKIGDLYINTNGGAGTTLWVKESGSGTNTGWVGK